MPELEKRMVAVAIGVASAPRLSHLAGAHNGVREFCDWARASGYETFPLQDKGGQTVTVKTLKATIYEAIGYNPQTRNIKKRPIHRFVLYFAGHGVIKEIEKGLWYLSDWESEGRVVHVELLKRRLASFGVRQISIFSDACQKLPQNTRTADLSEDSVIGYGPEEGIPSPAVDKFTATHDGMATIMIPGANPEQDRCLYSGVLMEGLWGKKEKAFSKLVTGCVTSSSLGTYLETEVLAMARQYGREIYSKSLPTFPEDDNIYFGKQSGLQAPNLPDWPPPGSVQLTDTDGPKSLAPALSTDRGQMLFNRMQQQRRPNHYETGSGFAIDGPPIKAMWVGMGYFAETFGDRKWWRIGKSEGNRLTAPIPVLIEFMDGLFAATTSIPEFIASVICEEDGVSATIYREVHADERIALQTELALSEIESGNLNFRAKANLAISLRQNKHVDPALGVIGAYLYDSIGDVESIRRMAYYYATFSRDGYYGRPQPIPYDIALLGLLNGGLRPDGQPWVAIPAVAETKPRTEAERQFKWTYEQTRATVGDVAGFWPWLRQGWPYLDENEEERNGSPLIHSGLARLKRYLTPSRFTTMREAGGRGLAELFNLCPMRG